MDALTLALSKKFTEETVVGGGAIKGKNCTIQNIEPVDGGNNVTFQWTLDDGTVKTQTMFVAEGPAGKDGVDGKSAYQIALNNGFEGTEEEWLKSLEANTDDIKTYIDNQIGGALNGTY